MKVIKYTLAGMDMANDFNSKKNDEKIYFSREEIPTLRSEQNGMRDHFPSEDQIAFPGFVFNFSLTNLIRRGLH